MRRAASPGGSSGILRIHASQHVGERCPGSCRCDAAFSHLGPGTGSKRGVLPAATGFAALVAQPGVQHDSHDGPRLDVPAPRCRKVMAGTDHRPGATGASVPAGSRVSLERDAAGHAHVMQLVGLLGVETHRVNVPAMVVADEAISLARRAQWVLLNIDRASVQASGSNRRIRRRPAHHRLPGMESANRRDVRRVYVHRARRPAVTSTNGSYDDHGPDDRRSPLTPVAEAGSCTTLAYPTGPVAG